MTITALQQFYSRHPGVSGLASVLENKDIKTVYLGGMHASCASLFASGFVKKKPGVYVFILNDGEEAGYFYHDIVQANGDEDTLFFPSSYRRAIKYGQKDAANEILRTEVLSRLGQKKDLVVVTYPDALAEKVVSRRALDEQTIVLKVGQQIETEKITEQLVNYGFEHVDYVYEPGQFAMRGSILDIYSFASEYPYRIDFFGEEIDSIRTFKVETQLSKEKKGWCFFAGFAAAITGIAMISLSSLDFSIESLKGDLLALSAAFVWAFYAIASKKIAGFGYSPLLTVRRSFIYGMAFMLVPLLLWNNIGTEREIFTFGNIAGLSFLGLAASALCFVLWNIAVEKLGPVKTSIFIYLVPVITVAASAVFLNEPVTLLSAAGTLLTLFGLFLSGFRK